MRASIFALALACLCGLAIDHLDLHAPWNAVKLLSFNRGDASDAAAGSYIQTPTVVGNTSFPGRSIEFDGTDDYVHYPDADFLSFTDGAGTDRPFSITAWVYLDATSAQRCIVSKEDFNGTNGSEWVFNIASGKLQGIIAAQSGNTGKIRTGNTTTLSAATWYFVAMTYSASETVAGIKLYVNGSEEGAYTTTLDTAMSGMSNTSAKLYIGISSGTKGTNYYDFDGKIDDVVIWTTELSAAEIGAMYATGLGVTR